MKKLISALCALMLAVSLAACSRGPAEHGGLLPLDPTDPPATEEPTAAPTVCVQTTAGTRRTSGKEDGRPCPPARIPTDVRGRPATLPPPAGLAGDGAALCLCQWSRSGELEHSGMLDAAAVAAVLDAANAAQWVERKAPGVQEFSFDSYVTLSSPAGGGTLLTLWKGISALCLDAPGGRVWLDQPEGADLAAALQGLEQQDAYPRSLYAVGVTGSAEDETIAQSAAGAMVQSLSAHEARDGASSGVESLCGNRLRFTFRCKLRVPEDTAAAWGVTPDAAGEGELTRSCVLVRDAVGFWHLAAVENV